MMVHELHFKSSSKLRNCLWLLIRGQETVKLIRRLGCVYSGITKNDAFWLLIFDLQRRQGLEEKHAQKQKMEQKRYTCKKTIDNYYRDHGQFIQNLIFCLAYHFITFLIICLLHMLNSQEVKPENIAPLFISTFQGSSTSQINDAYHTLIETSKRFSNQFIKTCEKILETQTKNHHLCQSVSNFIKIMTKIMIDGGLVDEQGPKDFIIRIQNIFDNKKIPIQYKQNIALSFIKAALHFRQSLQKIIGRVSFLYNTKETQKAVILSRAYLASESKINAKCQNFYYNKILKIEINCLSDQILSLRSILSEGNGQHFEAAQTKMKNIHELLKNIHSALVSIPFEKFQTSIFTCLGSQEILNAINALQIFRQNEPIIITLREIVKKILESVIRMRRTQKLPILMKVLSQNLHTEWKIFQENLISQSYTIYKSTDSVQGLELERQISEIKLITSGLNTKTILIFDDNFDVLNILVQPLFEIRTHLFQKDQQDLKETFMLFEDTCFSMKSECLEVQFNKFAKSLLCNYEIVSSKVNFTLDEILFSNPNFEEFLNNDQNNVIMLLNLLAFQISYFITSDSLLKKVENFLRKYQQLLFNKENPALYFHSLLILCNYLDDIFCEDLDAQIFLYISQNFISNRTQIDSGTSDSQLNLIAYFEKIILKNFYSSDFTTKEVQKEYEMLIEYLTTNFDDQAIQVFIKIMKHYKIEDRFTLDIFDKMLESINEITSNNLMANKLSYEKIHAFMQFLETFFDLEIYKHLFESTLSRVLPIFDVLISNQDLFMDEFFNLIKNAVNHLAYVPENYYSWMVNLFTSQKLQSQESFYSLISVLKNASPSKQNNDLKCETFVNCMALNLIEAIVQTLSSPIQGNQKFNSANILHQISNSEYFFAKNSQEKFTKKQVMCLLSLHQLIYYHSAYLTRKVLGQIIRFSAEQLDINQNRQQQRFASRSLKFSFVQGKYQLLFVLLFRRRLNDVNQILTCFGIKKKVYDAIYLGDFQYLIEYDTPILIKEQAQILKKFMVHDKLQMTYANSSFLVIFYKFCVLYGLNTNDKKKKNAYFNLESSDSDEEEFDKDSEFKSNFKDVTNLVKSFPLPQEWTQINELKEIKEFVMMLKSHEPSREWLKMLVENCLKKDQIKLMQDLMKDLENVNGAYRHIKRVNKNLQKSPNQNQEGVI